MKRLVGCVALALASLPGVSSGQGLGPNGSPITTNDFAIDLYQGPVLESARITSMGGAFVAMAEQAEGNALNPAACAARTAYSFDHFDYDLGAGITFPSSIRESDFFNTGKGRTSLPDTSQNQFVFLGLAGNLQFGAWGFGLNVGLQQYGLSRAPREGVQHDRIDAQIGTANLQVGRSFIDGQVIVGTGLRAVGLSVVNSNPPPGGERTLFKTQGSGFEFGMLWRPNGKQIRLGAAVHTAVSSEAADGQTSVLYQGTGEDLYLPRRVVLPWDVSFGFAVQLGPRPFNPRWVDPSDLLEEAERDALSERYHSMKRFKLLISGSVLMTGPVGDSVGVESFLERRVNRSGESVSLSPRLGMETEPVAHWLKVRAGGYLEPTRFRSNVKGYRNHVTVGFDSKLFEWTMFGLFGEGTEWRIGGSTDLARNYLGWGLSAGIWH
jgi:hypothetical protein